MSGIVKDGVWTRRGYALLVAYGIVIAAFGCLLLSRETPAGSDWPLLGTRVDELTAAYSTMEAEDAPPLVASLPPGLRLPSDPEGDSGADYRLVGQGDDQGLYVAVPLLARWLGLSEPREAIKYIYLALFALALASYPLIFGRLTGSVRASAAAPLVLLAGLLGLDGLIVRDFSGVPGDLYWVLAWAGIALLPPLLLLARARRWGPSAIGLLLGIALAAGATSALRINAGLPVVIAAVLIVLFSRDWSWPRRGALALAAVAVYALIVPAAMSAVRSNAESWAGDRGEVLAQLSTEHPFWHSIYIGSGYLPNDERIIYLDEVGFIRAQERDPDVIFLSPEYEAIERELFLDEVKEDPAGIAWQWLRKATVILRLSAWLLVGVASLLLAGWLLRARGERGLVGWALVVAAPGLVLGFATGLLVIPDAHYVLAFSGALLFLLVTGVAALADRASALAPSRERLREICGAFARSRTRRADRIAVVAFAGVLLLTLAGSAAGARVYSSYLDWQINSSGPADLAARMSYNRTDLDLSGQTSLRQGVAGPRPALDRAVRLDGLSGHVLSDYDPFERGGDLTVEGWARRASDDTEDTLFGGTDGAAPAILRVVAATGDVQFFPANGLFGSWPKAWPAGGDWVHWALAVSGDGDDEVTAQLYIDGAPQGEMQIGAAFSDGYNRFVVGGWSFNYRDPFGGDMAGIAAFERELGPEEIARHAEAGENYVETVLDSEPDLLWELGERGEIEAADSSGSGNDGVYAWGR